MPELLLQLLAQILLRHLHWTIQADPRICPYAYPWSLTVSFGLPSANAAVRSSPAKHQVS